MIDMNKILRKEDRGKASYGWLNARYYFSFANYFNPEWVHFGALRVLNDDIIDASSGFPEHPHDNMEIITIPLSGTVEHKDSMGHTSLIKTGDVQVMSAGKGITHSEFNASSTEPLSLLQIWIFPKVKNVQPRYQQKTFDERLRVNAFQCLVSPNQSSEDLWINQDAWIHISNIDKNVKIPYNVKKPGNGVFVLVIEGEVSLQEETLTNRDAIFIKAETSIELFAEADSKVLIIEIPL